MIKGFVSMGYRIYRLLSASFFGEFKKKQYLCSVIQSRISLAPFRTCTYMQVVSKRYAEDIWLIYFCGEYYDEDIINIRTRDSVTDMKKRENSVN